ncbi:MAG: hypothetical protein KGJ84_15310 [Elusimicrobia bacterium]|nr:hypothetical protein [Elusimicrobiota bacterium]
MKLHPDFRDLLEAFVRRQVDFVVIGAFALAHHGHPRATGDLDLWVRPCPDNAARALAALKDFGFESASLTADDFLSGQVIQLGRPPVRVDLLSALDGVGAQRIWDEKAGAEVDGLSLFFLSRECLIANKRAVGRTQDMADIEALEGDRPRPVE